MPCAVILTALPVEYLAVRTHLVELEERINPQGTIYEQGKFIGNEYEWEVGIAEVGAGNAGVAAETAQAIAYFQPNILLFVGIAGGIKDVAIGDVVVATDVYGYESGKAGEQFLTRPKAGKSAYALVQRAKSEARKGEWLQRLSSNSVPQPRVFVAPIAAGEKIVASRQSDIFQFLRASYNDAIAVEMEGFGFLNAAFAPNIQAIVIRGISDLIEGKNGDSVEPEAVRQEKASHHASAFAFEVLSKFQIEETARDLLKNKIPVTGLISRISREITGTLLSRKSPKSPSIKSSLPLRLPESAQTMSSDPTPPKVFISYSHDSQEHKKRMLALADRLREDGIDSNIDQYEDSPPEGWQRWMLNQVEAADYTLIACTQQYDRRFRGQEETGRGKGVIWEGGVIIQEVYDAQGRNSKFIPITFTPQDSEFVPSLLRSATLYKLDTADGYELLYRRLTNQPRRRKPDLGKLRTLAPRERKQLFQEESLSPTSNSSPKHQALHPNFFAYDDAWVGRDNLIRELSDRIRNNCRLLILVGITGIGKTALGERLAVEVADWFESDWTHYHQENFDNEQQTSDFASVAARWLEKWGELITPDDRKDPQRLLYRLIKHLRENRYLVQIDSLENILQGNEEEGWNDFQDEWWLKFFDSYLKAESCESCLILTSQDLPGQIEEVGTRSQNFWYCQPLSGLEKPEQIALFEKTELDISPNSEGKTFLERIGAAYEGHPLALRVIAGEIKNKPFEGNIVAYWNRYRSELEEVEKALAEAKEVKSTGAEDKFQLDRFTKMLKRNVRSRLNKTFARLKEDAKWSYILLCEASVYRCPVPEDFWLSHLEDWDRNENEQEAALETLKERYLVEESTEKDQLLLRQHNLIRSVSLEHLKQLD
ncbi:MAG: TIR domain-containing protein [Symploca sp. SIO1A3]|nr:TIR domain-containing protein [Symploca sp. SIO1A3]